MDLKKYNMCGFEILMTEERKLEYMSIVPQEHWIEHRSMIYDREDAIACLRIVVTLYKLGFCRDFRNEDCLQKRIDGNTTIWNPEGIEISVWT